MVHCQVDSLDVGGLYENTFLFNRTHGCCPENISPGQNAIVMMSRSRNAGNTNQFHIDHLIRVWTYAKTIEIRLGLLRFHAEVQEPNDQFWSYMNKEVLPQVRSAVEAKKGFARHDYWGQ